LMFFFLAKGVFYFGTYGSAAEELATRTGHLIEWNMINHKGSINADETKMTAALEASDRFKLSDMKTGFSITTTADMRMLFLSMPFAQDFSAKRGIGMPETIPIKVTDYRGY